MLKIRLKRLGRKKKPSYRIILIDSRRRRDGKPIQELGFYNPFTKQIKINLIEIQNYLNQGAQLTPTVKTLFMKAISNTQ